jgi:hypothetical protein
MPLTTYATLRPAILLGSHAAQPLRTRDLQPSNDGARSARHRHGGADVVLTPDQNIENNPMQSSVVSLAWML